MNTQIRRLGIGLLACYIALFVMLNYIQVVHKQALDDNKLNDLRVKEEFNKPRGSITTADGVLLAQSIDVQGSSDFKRKRVYPQANLFAQITGYYSFLYGSSGLEDTYDKELTGQTIDEQIRGFADILDPRPQVGNLTLTVNAKLQRIAAQALGNRAGSVVALDPRTGAILAFWSYPSFDPNQISSLDEKTSRTAWTLYNLGEGKPLLAHQYQELYQPGSTFKLVTGSTGVQDGVVTPENPSYPYSHFYVPPGRQTTAVISNFGGEGCGGTLFLILAKSCNSAFAQMGTETIGGPKMVAGAQAFGWNRTPPIDLPGAARSRFPDAFLHTNPENYPALAQQSIGQGSVVGSPLQIALDVAAIANGGTIMRPHVMKEVRDSEGAVIEKYHIAPWLTPISASTAQTMREAMLDVVATGTATGMAIPGYEIGAKTGTAEIGNTNTVQAWMSAYGGLPGQEPTIAVAVVVLNQPGFGESTGASVAGPIAKQVMQAYLSGSGSGH
jgi:peptidoglycan glycosyltransferase